MNLIKFNKKKLKNKDFLGYPGFRFEPYAQKQKFENHGNSTATILKYQGVASKISWGVLQIK